MRNLASLGFRMWRCEVPTFRGCVVTSTSPVADVLIQYAENVALASIAFESGRIYFRSTVGARLVFVAGITEFLDAFGPVALCCPPENECENFSHLERDR